MGDPRLLQPAWRQSWKTTRGCCPARPGGSDCRSRMARLGRVARRSGHARRAERRRAAVNTVRIRTATPADCEPLSRLRESLWPDASAEEHAKELASLLTERKNGTMPLVIFVAEAAGESLVGFLEAGLRSHADGCNPT